MTDEMKEAPRPDPGFRVYVDRQGQLTDVTDAVMDVYDIAIGSMDFGSGFLSTEEVGNLRALGKAIGAERFDYQHDKCLRCGHDWERHTEMSPQRCWQRGTHITDPDCDCKGFVRPEPMSTTCVCGRPVAADNTGYCENCLEASEHEDCQECQR